MTMDVALSEREKRTGSSARLKHRRLASRSHFLAGYWSSRCDDSSPSFLGKRIRLKESAESGDQMAISRIADSSESVLCISLLYWGMPSCEIGIAPASAGVRRERSQ
jgi:hypothetical protein